MTETENVKRTSPNTLAIQASKTVRSRAEWLWISVSDEPGLGKGTYNVGKKKAKRERYLEKKREAKEKRNETRNN
jgi:hypothetical protein